MSDKSLFRQRLVRRAKVHPLRSRANHVTTLPFGRTASTNVPERRYRLPAAGRAVEGGSRSVGNVLDPGGWRDLAVVEHRDLEQGAM
jgi:hypothetical protein